MVSFHFHVVLTLRPITAPQAPAARTRPPSLTPGAIPTRTATRRRHPHSQVHPHHPAQDHVLRVVAVVAIATAAEKTRSPPSTTPPLDHDGQLRLCADVQQMTVPCHAVGGIQEVKAMRVERAIVGHDHQRREVDNA